MPPLPASDKWFTESTEGNTGEQKHSQNTHILDSQLHLTLLIVGTGHGKVMLYSFGLVHCATIDIAAKVPGTKQILDATSSGDMNMLSVVIERRMELAPDVEGVGKPGRDITHVVVDMTVCAERHRELFQLTKKYAELTALYEYSTEAMTELRDTWEGIMLEVDAKLETYAGKKEEGEVSLEFMELMVLGFASPEFQMFLSTKLTEKGLKKLRQNVELSYTDMHKLVVKKLEAVGQGMAYVLSQVRGMALTKDRFGILGVEESIVVAAIKEAGSFLLKSTELQRMISWSMKNFMAFLRWLSHMHLLLTGATVPPELAKSTRDEVRNIFEFMENIEDVIVDRDGKTFRKFKLEKVGQYLKDEDLKIPPETANNPWIQFLEKCPEMHKQPFIIPQRRTCSLVQEHKKLSKELDRMVLASINEIGRNIRIGKGISLFPLHGEASDVIISQRSQDEFQNMHLMIVPSSQSSIFYFCQWNTDVNDIFEQVTEQDRLDKMKVASFTFSQNPASLVTSPNKSTTSEHPANEGGYIIAGQFYNGDTISMIMEDFNNSMRSLFVQIPVHVLSSCLIGMRVPEECSVSDSGLSPVDLSKEATSTRRLDINAGLFGVSGERKVAAVVANHRRTMLLYEMEVDDDDEDEDEELDEQDRSNVS